MYMCMVDGITGMTAFLKTNILILLIVLTANICVLVPSTKSHNYQRFLLMC